MRGRGAGRRAHVAAAAAAAVAALALGACGGDSDGEQEALPLGKVRVGSVAQLAECRDWNRGSRDQQLATIAQIKEQINLQDSNVETPELSDEDAYAVLDNTCANGFADGFRLYKLYARAASFAAFAED